MSGLTYRQDQKFFPYVRQKGLDNYNNEKLEFIVCQMLTDNLPAIKDSINVFYKDITKYADQEDAGYSLLLKRHGFKSQFVREPKDVRFLMEIYKPVLLKKAKKRIRLRK